MKDEDTKTNWTKNALWTISIAISIAMFVYQVMRQNQLENQLIKAEQNAIHRAETNYSLIISGLLQSATIIETNLVEQKNHNLILIKCAKLKNCNDEILVEKIQKPYVPIAEHYLKVKEQMTEESLENR